jgi:predicted PurR-regulated permease PerM
MSTSTAHEPAFDRTPRAGRRRSTSTGVVLLLSTLFLVWVCLPLWKPLLLGTVFAAAAFRLHERLAMRLGGRRTLSALVFTLMATVLLLGPLAVLAVTGARQALAALAWVREALAQGALSEVLRSLPDTIERWLRPMLPESFVRLPVESEQAGRWAALQLRSALLALSGLAFELAMMMIAFFFVLVDGRRLTGWLEGASPLGRRRTRELVEEFSLVARSVLGSNLATGLVQAAVASIGYLAARAPEPLFFGFATLLASFIPSVGTALVTMPLSGLLLLQGRPWAALFLALWSLLVVALVDSILRPWLIKTEVQIHGAAVFFSMIGGTMLFGLSGLVIGPMALSFFLTMMRFHARDLRRGSAPPAPRDRAAKVVPGPIGLVPAATADASERATPDKEHPCAT